MLKRITIALLIILPLAVMGQDETMVLTGRVTDAKSGKALAGAHIVVSKQRTAAATDLDGNYTLRIRRKGNVIVSATFVGYGNLKKMLHKSILSDTIVLNLQLSMVPNEIAPVQITARTHPDTVFGSFSYCVVDFEFYRDKFLLLTYKSREQKSCSLMLQDGKGEILITARVPGNATSLYLDYEDRYYVICDDNVFRIKIESSLLLLIPMSTAFFTTNVKPGIDMIGEKIIFSDYRWHYPEFSYYTVWKNDTIVEELKTVVDEELMRMYRFEYYYLNNEQRVASWKMAAQYEGLDEYDAAAIMTGFQQTLYYEELYAPLFIVDDTVLLFDHYANKLYKYDRMNRVVDSVNIAYHQDRGALKWKKELVKDKGNGDIYAVFQKNGHYYLNAVDTKRGTLDGSFKMSDKYAENMKIKDDYVYYVCDPQDRYQTPFLYKELIQL